MTENDVGGSMDDYPLTLTSIIERAERLSRRSRGGVPAPVWSGHPRNARVPAPAGPVGLPVRWPNLA